jgi:hypothetical protein
MVSATADMDRPAAAAKAILHRFLSSDLTPVPVMNNHLELFGEKEAASPPRSKP